MKKVLKVMKRPERKRVVKAVSRKRCVGCGSGDTYPVRMARGAHWWRCSRCGEEF